MLTLMIVFALTYGGKSTVDLTVTQILLISLAAAAVPAGSYTGFVALFMRVGELSHRGAVLLTVFCLPIILAANLYGVIILIPYFISRVHLVLKNNT